MPIDWNLLGVLRGRGSRNRVFDEKGHDEEEADCGEETERDRALRCIQMLRCENFSVLYPFGKAKVLSKQLKKAYVEQPRYILIFTHELSSRGKVQVKCLADETTREVDLEEVAEVFKEERKSEA